MNFVRLVYVIILVLIIPSSLLAKTVESPQLIGKTTSGGNFDLNQKKGKVVIVNFWITWCGECRKELMVLDKIYKQYHSQGLEVIGLNIDDKTGREEAAKIIKALPYPNILWDNITKSDFKMPAQIPVTYLIKKDGKVAGEVDREQLEDTVKKLLNEK